tara:strand:+ start:268 stop:444 length:177 start_codon:yes stop_codon:yes gene_type:complete
MNVGDLVKVKDGHWDCGGMIGIIIHDVGGEGTGFKVLLANGIIRPKMRSNIMVVNESG